MMFVWFGVVLLVRFPADVAPGEWLLARHRGANRLPEERKTEAEASPRPTDDKAKQRKLREKARQGQKRPGSRAAPAPV